MRYTRSAINDDFVDTAEIEEDGRVVHIGIQKTNSYIGSGGFDLKQTAAYAEVRNRDVAEVLAVICPKFGAWLKPAVRQCSELVVLQTEFSPSAREAWSLHVPQRSNHSMRLLQQPQCLSNLIPVFSQLAEVARPPESTAPSTKSVFWHRLKRLWRF